MLPRPVRPPMRAVALCILLLAGMPAELRAQETPPLPIAILDVQGVLKRAKAAQDIRSQIETLRTAFQKDVREQEQTLRKADQELAQQRAILSAEAFAARRKEFEGRARAAQQKVQERKRGLERMFGAAMLKVQRAMEEITADIAKERNLAIVLPRQTVVLSETRLDISKEVLTRLDRKLPAVKVEPVEE